MVGVRVCAKMLILLNISLLIGILSCAYGVYIYIQLRKDITLGKEVLKQMERSTRRYDDSIEAKRNRVGKRATDSVL